MKKTARKSREGGPRGPYDVVHRAEASELTAVQAFRNNVRSLLAEAKTMNPELTRELVAKKAGISPRALAYQRDDDNTSAPNLRTLDSIAKAMGVEPWQLLFPDFPAQISLNPVLRKQVRETIRRYLGAEPDARPAVDKVAVLLPQRSKS